MKYEIYIYRNDATADGKPSRSQVYQQEFDDLVVGNVVRMLNEDPMVKFLDKLNPTMLKGIGSTGDGCDKALCAAPTHKCDYCKPSGLGSFAGAPGRGGGGVS